MKKMDIKSNYNSKNSIVFVQREMEDKLGPMILSAFIKKFGFETEIIVNPYKFLSEIRKLKPTFIGISLLTPSLDWTLETCSFLKMKLPKSKIVIGGPHPTFFPDVIKEKNVDIVCIGEGEMALLNLLKNYDGTLQSVKFIPNLWVKNGNEITKNPIGALLNEDELSHLPGADTSYYQRYPLLRNSSYKKTWATRGCPFNCAFCFNTAYKDLYSRDRIRKAVRWRSVNSIIKELSELKKFGWKTLEIVDDQFLLSKSWVAEFCERYRREINLPFTCNTTAQQLKPEVVALIKKAGCCTVCFGIESGVEKIRKEIYNKPVSDEDIYKAGDALHTHNLPFQTFNMVGLPGETLENIYRTVEINQEIKTTHPWCSIIQPYPGTPIAEYFKKMNSLSGAKFSYTYFQNSHVTDQNEARIFSNSHKLFAYLIKNNISFNQFKRLVVEPPLKLDKLYPSVFYYHFGKSKKKIIGISWLMLFRYWLYSQSMESKKGYYFWSFFKWL